MACTLNGSEIKKRSELVSPDLSNENIHFYEIFTANSSMRTEEFPSLADDYQLRNGKNSATEKIEESGRVSDEIKKPELVGSGISKSSISAKDTVNSDCILANMPDFAKRKGIDVSENLSCLENPDSDTFCDEKKKPELVGSGVDKVSIFANTDDSSTLIIADMPDFAKRKGIYMSQTESFIKLKRNEKVEWLMANHPFAYLLLNLVALRAMRTPNHPSGLQIGEALIGDHKSIGATRGQYRHALDVLILNTLLIKVETCRNRKKATTGTTTVGTKVRLLNSDIWDINPEINNHRNNHPTTTEQPPNNHEEECKEYKECKKDIDKPKRSINVDDDKYATPTAKPRSASTRSKPKIYFDWDKKKLMGIEQVDLDAWKEAFPFIENVQNFIAWVECDIAARPTKYQKRKNIERSVIYYFKNKNEELSRSRKFNNKTPQPKLNHDTTPSHPSKSISFANY